jgi:protein involved in polysaccharide export with SLBB domain
MLSVSQPTTAPTAVRNIPPEYRLGPGDEISITFPMNAELNHDGPIGPDGRFTMPLIGSLLLEGDTVNEATLKIANALREDKIVADAEPSLTIRHYNASIYVGGEIRLPGVQTLSTGMDALQAVIAAGGLLETARTKHVAIIRRTPDGRASITFIDLRSYLRGTTASRFVLQPRDVVFVPKSSVAEADTWIDQYLNKLLPFGRSLNYNLGNYGTTSVIP